MSLIKFGNCSNPDCGLRNVPIYNVRYMLCGKCNKERLNGERSHKVKSPIIITRRLSPAPRKISNRGLSVIKMDEDYYEFIWNSRPHVCEECGVFLGDDFRDSNGKVVDRWRYSHILSKGRWSVLRHHKKNMNLLCLKHHQQWETGDRALMKIYLTNLVLIQEMHEELAGENK